MESDTLCRQLGAMSTLLKVLQAPKEGVYPNHCPSGCTESMTDIQLCPC